MYYLRASLRRLIATFALALFALGLFCLAPAARADTADVDVGFSGTEHETHVEVYPGQTVARKLAVRVRWTGAAHLSGGSSVRFEPTTTPPPAWTSVGGATVAIPTGWNVFQTALGDAEYSYTAPQQLGLFVWTATWAATSLTCDLGGSACLDGSPQVDLSARVRPHSPVVSVAPGVTEADVTWESEDHALLTNYFVVRYRTDGTIRPDGSPGIHPTDPQILQRSLPLAPDRTYHDSGLSPDTTYCWRINAQYIAGGNNSVSSQEDKYVCKRTDPLPAAPGAPAGPDVTNAAGFDLGWDPSTTSGVRYDVDHRDADDGDWSRLASDVATPAVVPAETDGTWTYRVRATKGGGASAWVQSAAPVKVDRGKPDAPVAAADRAPEYDGWFKDTVTVSFDGSVDPALADTSAGSGVDTYSAAQTFDDHGDHTAAGTATDRAGNTSDATTLDVRVDTSVPAAAFVNCPTEPVLLNADVGADWAATDTGSGLATPADGSVALDTATAGSKTASAPEARDRVGHATQPADCTYEVNTPPAAPGAPAGPEFDRDGHFDVDWPAASDPDGDAVAYVLEQSDASGAWTEAVAGGDTPHHAAEVPGDGSWRFRVKAVDSRGASSGWVESAAAVVVDGQRPTAPAVVTDSAGTPDGWFKDSVSVSFDGSTDPALPDGSDGSGVASYSDGETFDTEGHHELDGYANDRAGNRSAATRAVVNVDRTPPKVAIECPAGRVVQDAAASAAWTATDDESGLATPASGSVALDTSVVGSHVAEAPTARDAVGHATDASCDYTVVPPNSPPGAPGAPSGPAFDRDGSFDLHWTAAADPDAGDVVTYLVEQRDANDLDWSSAGAAVDQASIALDLADGTWRFRVTALDGDGAVSDWVESDAPVIVDGGKPSAPVASTTPAAPAHDGWFKDSVKVTFAGSTDPALDDASAGSGVDSYTAPVTFDTSGSHTATGTATDRAGNESDASTLDVKVDATAPTSEIACPTAALIVGQPGQTATWTASDDESGLASPASGTVALNTATAGTKTATAPEAIDNVGHTGDGATCEYEVRYRFSGSSQINVGKVGKTYPVRWELRRWNGSLISDAEGAALAQQMSASDAKVACSTFLSAPEEELDETVSGAGGLRYDTRKNEFVYAYMAPARGCYVLSIRRADGVNARHWRFLFT